jgi:hypothetical protein
VKALTISQPYAGLIADGLKFVENRGWQTNYRGWLAIHAGKGTQYLTKRELAEYPKGCIVAVVSLDACESFSNLRRLLAANSRQPVGGRAVSEIFGHKHCEGPECWILGERVTLPEPIPCTGKQGLWSPPAGVTRQLAELLAAKGLI